MCLRKFFRWYFIGLIKLFCFAAYAQNPLQITIGKQTIQNNDVLIPVTIHIQKGWKLYAPPRPNDTITYAPTLPTKGFQCQPLPVNKKDSEYLGPQNVQYILAQWPKSEQVQENGQKISFYKEAVTFILKIRLLEKKNTSISIPLKCLACEKSCVPISESIKILMNADSLSGKDSVENLFLNKLKMIFLAFLGGVILNFMPCVLPVLGLKLRSFSTSASRFRESCLYTALGILTSFWLMAFFVVAMKYIFQYEIGWGMQFQNIYFSTFMCLLMFGFSMSLLGFFHLSSPQWAEKVIPKTGKKNISAFITGILSTLLATPCSAPFLGAALGFALLGSAFDIFLTFNMIAVGFSFPYWVGFYFPSMTELLPRSGKWSVYLERAVGILFLLTAAWLMSTTVTPNLRMTLQIYAWGILSVIFLGFFLIHILQGIFIKKIWSWISLLAIVFFVVMTTSSDHQKTDPIVMNDGPIKWKKFCESELEKGLSEGKIVFIDITAQWCQNCHANKWRTFNHGDVQSALSDKEILCLRGDLTSDNPVLWQFLKRYKRVAIPFNLIISREHPMGIVLSEWLTAEEVLKALKFLQGLQKQKGIH